MMVLRKKYVKSFFELKIMYYLCSQVITTQLKKIAMAAKARNILSSLYKFGYSLYVLVCQQFTPSL